MKIKHNFFLIIALLAFSFLIGPSSEASVCSDYSYLEVVARDPDGNYIPGVKAELYHQVLDADGNTKPGSRISTATANASTGIASLRFRNSNETSATYAVRLQSINKDFTSYWYYNIEIACGETVSIEKTLSALEIVLRDYESKLIYNTNFSLYVQGSDADGNPVKQKKDLVATLNSGSTGATRVYVPAGSVHSLDGSRGDYYALEITRNREKFYLYDLKVTEGQLTKATYSASAFKLTLRTSLGALFPGKTKLEVYEQTVDDNNNESRGSKLADIQTTDEGFAIFEAPAGVYVAGLKNSSGQYDYLWDLEIWDGQLNEYEWTVSSAQTSVGVCAVSSKLSLSFSGLGGETLAGFKYDVYEQDMDTFGRPIAGKRVGGGSTNSFGRADTSFKPDPRKNYVVRVYEKKSDLGEFWFFDAVRFTCGNDRSFSRSLPYLEIVLRDGNGDLKKDQSFSIYEQAFDADNNPVKDNKNLIANLKTGSSGSALLYVGPTHPFNQSKRGLYIFSATVGKSVFNAYNIAVDPNRNSSFEYTFSDLSLNVKSAAGQTYTNEEVRLYAQIKEGNNYRLGDLLSSAKTDAGGNVRFEYPAGTYAVAVKDSFKQDNVFWNVEIKDGKTNRANINFNVSKVTLSSPLGELMPTNTALKVFSLYEGQSGFYKDKEVGTVKLGNNKRAEIFLAAGPYLISYIDNDKNEYGLAFWAQNGKVNSLEIKMNKTMQIVAGERFSLSRPALSTAITSSGSNASNSPATPSSSGPLNQRLAGYILLQVEDKGKAWYVNPKNRQRYYLANGSSAFAIMRQAGVGITNSDLSKIPIGLDKRFNLQDSDGDLLPDGLEVAIGTDPFNSDTDGDAYLDGEEVLSGYNPLGTGRLTFNHNFANSQKGKIFLQVERHGEAWYVNPADGKRYYLGNGDSAFEIMRYLSLGISNQNLNTISIGQ
jgi:hypothetical protein